MKKIPPYLSLGLVFTALMALISTPALAHVKWFAPYIVGTAPQPLMQTLSNPWFWMAIFLVLTFFSSTVLIERTKAGTLTTSILDRITDPLWQRMDDFLRFVISMFFVAIFSIGGVYLTPDLTTPAEWVSWSQLLIAILVFSRRTQPLAAACIIGLWLLALRDYDFFHLLDYLALGVGVAGYLVLDASNNPTWRKHRFEILRCGVAVALMWSSLEKFAYPQWFYPLVEERPFLTFGLPRDVFIPMAGIAEFTLGFGFIWTPLVRRLSAIALFIIFSAAVYPFGRIDLVGHALIMAVILGIIADRDRATSFFTRFKQQTWSVYIGLFTALVLFGSAYWGIHRLIYGPQGNGQDVAATYSTHMPNAENPHGAIGLIDQKEIDNAGSAQDAYTTAMHLMHVPMMDGIRHPNPDAAFVLGMIPHHKGALDMALIQLKYGTDPQMIKLAKDILHSQHFEVVMMERWLKQKNIQPVPPEPQNTGHEGHTMP